MKITLKSKLQGFFLGGGVATQYALAKRFNTTSDTIRKTISTLRKSGFQVEKILPSRAGKPLHAEYRAALTTDIAAPKIGRPSHENKFFPHVGIGL